VGPHTATDDISEISFWKHVGVFFLMCIQRHGCGDKTNYVYRCI
jgi:hypothetical protein